MNTSVENGLAAIDTEVKRSLVSEKSEGTTAEIKKKNTRRKDTEEAVEADVELENEVHHSELLVLLGMVDEMVLGRDYIAKV